LVPSEIRPDASGEGTETEIEVAVDEVTGAEVRLNFRESLAAVISKLVPVTLMAFPATPLPGLKDVMVGAPDPPLMTVKEVVLLAVPEGLVTLMVPVVAPDGTVATSCVDVADVTVAWVPLKDTES
jgi:hypothetical protein